ncbi:response regulator [Methanoregula sp.]|uniref:response regulator n=1 Tax=Methanoregula sp. TaxID=2052170 RepID=UPI002375B085|nr:response regulator [Methanoregula sp.]MDD1687106.1 response regulator [Methanoregula sp.]
MLHSALQRAAHHVTSFQDSTRITHEAGGVTPQDAVSSSRQPAVSADAPHPISVLLVDDEDVLLDVGKVFLERSPGIQVTVAPSAVEALALMRHTPYDAIVSDYQMPEMDGLAFLREVRRTDASIPFIIFTGKGREEVVIEALNGGADSYIQKGGEPKAQYAELLHKIHRAVRQRRADAELKKKHEILQAILRASPNGIAFVRNRTFQWVNGSLAKVLGFTPAELRGMHLRDLYENKETYERIGAKIHEDLLNHGTSRITTRFRHKNGIALEYTIHIAPLDRGNLHFGHMIMMTDPSRRMDVTRGLPDPAPFPHMELTPVIELNRECQITYFNDAAIDAMVRYGSRGTLEEFFPSDIRDILRGMEKNHTESVSRDVLIGPVIFRVHITLSPRFGVARLSAVRQPAGEQPTGIMNTGPMGNGR